MDIDAFQTMANLQPCFKYESENELADLSREELIERLKHSENELQNNSRGNTDFLRKDLVIAAEIGQQLLHANQSLRHAYDELLNPSTPSDTVKDSPFKTRVLSIPTTPTKVQSRIYSPLSPSPKKLQSFNMSDYVESLEKSNHESSQELELIMRQLSQSNRHNQKLTRDLEVCTQEMNALKQQIVLSSVSKQGLIQKEDKGLIADLKRKLLIIETENMNLMEKTLAQEKEIQKYVEESKITEDSSLRKNLDESLKLSQQLTNSGKTIKKTFDHVQTQTLDSKLDSKSASSQTVDKSIEKESISYFKSLAFINAGESPTSDLRRDQLFIPCRFPTSPSGTLRTKSFQRDEWVMEIPEDLGLDHCISSLKRPPLIPRHDRLRVLMGQFINYVSDLIL